MPLAYARAPPPPAPPRLLCAPPPPPTTTAATLVTPAGTTQLYVPAVVYVAHVAFLAVMLLEAALHALEPDALVALT